MAHSLVPPSATTVMPTSVTQKKIALPIQRAVQKNCHLDLSEVQCGKLATQISHRRNLVYGLIAAGFGSLWTPENANAAKRRPPPPPTEEKKDPNMSALQAKVFASIKRKEAMKEAMAKLREKGKPVD
ncbi:uncharacterized protein [Typha latifolia]|uniref:uncharacterized protein n=1 Tax=Typha latifolia TaxID=4733 RepID=UPI003C2E3F49